MLKSKLVLAIAMSATALAGCASTGGVSGPRAELRMSPEQLARTATQQDVMLDQQMHFDESGHALPSRPMSATEAVMSAQIEQHCLALTHDRIRGQAKSMVKKATVGGVLMALGTGIGSLLLPGMKLGGALRMGGYGGASGIASGFFTGEISIEQARSIVNSYCQIMQINNLRATGDKRLVDVIAIPAVGLDSSRPRVDWNAITPSYMQKCLREAGMDAAQVEHCRKEALNVPNDTNSPPPITIP